MIGLSALRLRLPHPVRWLVAVCFAAAVIVGLMGMHTISSGHTAPTTSENVEMPGGAPHHSSAPATGDEDAEACASCSPSGGHDVLMMMCVLALLAAALVLLVPRAAWSSVWERHALRPPVTRCRPAPDRPPSLLELSLSLIHI